MKPTCLSAFSTFLATASLCLPLHSESTPVEPAEFGSLELDQLVNVKVITPNRSLERVWDTPAAIQAITSEDIRRSGATSIPDALLLVPGMDVAHSTARGRAVSARGFNDTLADKLLVLFDGRSVYDPFQSGVRWHYQDALLEDIARIEVIRGPGGTSWGANAINGIVNVISKPAWETQGLLLDATAGTYPAAEASLRYGLPLSDEAWGRVYGKYRTSGDSETAAGTSGYDAWSSAQGGFRVDWEPGPEALFTLQGDVFYQQGDLESTDVLLTPVNGSYQLTALDQSHYRSANILGRWRRTLGENADFTLQTYYDRTDESVTQFESEADTYDVDAVLRGPVLPWLELTGGLGYRVVVDDFSGSFVTSYDPAAYTRHVYSAYMQGEVPLVEERLFLTLGSKFEHNPFTGSEFQPSARLLWKASEIRTFWAAATRAVRTGYRDYQGLRVNAAAFPTVPANPAAPTTVVRIGGPNQGVDAEETVALELGHRWRVRGNLALDAAAFYNIHREMVGYVRQPGTVVETTPAPSHLLAVSVPENILKGESYGLEASLTWEAAEVLRVALTYSLCELELHRLRGPATLEARELGSPHQQAGLRVSVNLTPDVTCDGWLRFVDEITAVPAYTTLDVRLAWRVTPHVELAVIGQNLLEPSHPEFRNLSVLGLAEREVPRTVQGRLTLRF
jgi:iron complex outermembrane receptor protein